MFESMRAARSLSPLFLGIFFMFIGDALVIASAGIMLKESGHSELEIGLISAFFFLGAIFSGFFVPSIIGALSYVRAYAVFTALFGIAAMLHCCTILAQTSCIGRFYALFWAFATTRF